jgi:hypothetical protein
MRKVFGKSTADPAAGLPVGARLDFKPEIFPIGSSPGEYTVDNWDHFGCVLLQLHLVDGNTVSVHGSAVLVAPGVAIAAKHVIEGFLTRLSIEEGASLSCMSIASSQAMIWHCRKITILPDADLAILILRYASALPPESIFRMAAITTRLPKVGEQVSMVGFTAMGGEFPFDPVGYTVVGHVRVSVGTIGARYPTGRDKIMVPWPALEIASSASGGMSGGPVFDKHGLLLGIVSTSFGAEDHIGPSYVSLLWPALMTPIDAEWPNGVHVSGRSLHEFGRLCCIDRREALRRTSPTSWEYTAWESAKADDGPNPSPAHR